MKPLNIYPNNTTMPDDHLMTVDEVATYLKVHPRTVRNYLVRRYGALPHVKPAGRVMVLRGDLGKWLNGAFKTKKRRAEA
jgi:excisionase family DNA binding protein